VHIYEYPPEIRKAIYTTNAVESLNSVIRAATKRRKVFPSEDSARKVIYLAIARAAKKWTMPIQNWRMALNRFVIEFGDRLPITSLSVILCSRHKIILPRRKYAPEEEVGRSGPACYLFKQSVAPVRYMLTNKKISQRQNRVSQLTYDS
jgi:Transposase, Mutator family